MKNVADEKYISLICTGEFNAIPDFKIGELFESFFDNINYNVIKENNKVFVDFTGEAMCDNEPCTILIRFEVNNNIEDFEISKIKVNDDILNEEETIDLLEDIAFVGGAILEDDYCLNCEETDCENCAFDDENNDFFNKDENEDNNDN